MKVAQDCSVDHTRILTFPLEQHSPIPYRPVTRIEVREFIDMAELLPDDLETVTTETLPKSNKQCHAISNILERIRCFSAYIAVISTKQPYRVPNLLGYLMLITKAHMEYGGDGWMRYDRWFRQIAATRKCYLGTDQYYYVAGSIFRNYIWRKCKWWLI